MGKRDNLAAGIMTVFIIIIFLVTAYFCIDIFGVVDIPDSLSLTRLFKSSPDEIAISTNVDKLVITQDNIDEWINEITTVDTQEENQDDKNDNSTQTEVVERDLSSQQVEETPVVTTPEVPEISGTPSTSEARPSVNPTSRMYYYQLDIYGKMIYDRVYDNLDNLKTGTYSVKFDTLFNDLLHEDGGDAVLEQAFQYGMNALLFDHPEIFFLDITKMYMSTEITSFGPLKTYRVSIGSLEGESYLSESFYNKQSVDVVSEMLATVKSNIKGSLVHDDDFTIIKAVHDYIVDTASYDKSLSKDNIYNIYGALINKEAVCEGYAKSLKYILDDFGIPCIIVCGTAQNSNGQTESHAWNYVRIGDSWYAVDVTWDDPLILGTGYVSDSVYTKYFLKGSRDFFTDHTEDGKIVDEAHFVYPTLNAENY